MKSLFAFFKQQVTLAHVYGIPVRINYSWFFVFAALVWLSAVSIPDSLVGGAGAKLLLGAGAILILFLSIFLHELAHAVVARREGIEVLEILLHPFGGLARLRREPDTPGKEFRIAIAGPVASFFIALAFLGLWFLTSGPAGKSILAPLLFILFLLNFLLAVFNLFPGYPLDGGRVLRAFLWRRGTDLNEATVTTGKFGQIIAVALVVFGLVIILLRQDVVTGIWTILIGVFLFDSAYGIIRQVTDLNSLRAEDVMELPVPVEPATTVSRFVDEVVPLYRQAVYPVARDRQFYGFVMLADLKNDLPREKWRETRIAEVMRPVREDHFVETDTSVAEARELMRSNGVGAVGVLDDRGRLVGFLQRGRIRRRR